MASKMQPDGLYSRIFYSGGHYYMLSLVIDSLFGCSHRRTTFPITPKRAVRPGAYVTCLDCGKEFAYNWTEMRREEDPAAALPVTVPVSSTARQAQGLSRLLRLGS